MILLTPHLTTVHATFLQLQEFIYSLKIQTHTCFFFFFGPYDPHIFAPSLICGFTVKPLLQCTTQRRLACGSVCWCQKRCSLYLHFFQAAIRSARLSPAMQMKGYFFFFFFFSRNSRGKKGFKVEILTAKTVNCDCLTKLLAV